MVTRSLGIDGVDVSMICLGAMALGTLQDRDTSFAILDRYLELGGNFIDTANNYMFWHPDGTGDESELMVGQWLTDRGVRDQIVLATKVGARPLTPGDRTLDNVEPLTAQRINHALDESLRRLGTDYVDMYWAHLDDRATDVADTVAGFGAAVASGKARLVGASNYAAWRVEEARARAAQENVAAYSAMQNRYSYLQPRPEAPLPESAHVHATASDLDYVRNREGMVLLAYNSLLAGAYARTDKPLAPAYDHPGTTARLAALDEVAKETGASRNQVVIAWLLAHDAPIIPLCGVSSVAQLEEVMAATELNLQSEQLERLNTATLLSPSWWRSG